MAHRRPTAAPVRFPLALACAAALLLALVTAPPAASTAPAASAAPAAPAAPGAPAAGEGAFRTVLVIDATSTLRATDPEDFRKIAAELYVDLAREGDQIAVTGFDAAARESTGAFTTIRSPEDRAALKRAIRALGNDGKWTDFTAGLAEARRLLDAAHSAPGDQELILFLTDGRCDPDPRGPLAGAARAVPGRRVDAYCQERVLLDIVPALGGTRVYPIALTLGAPRAFLEILAQRTGGMSFTARKAAELPRLFAGVLARLHGSTLREGPTAAEITIPVNEGARSLDVVLFAPPRVGARLLAPAGAEIPTDNQRPDRAYFVDGADYRLFKIRRPAQGPWKLLSGAGGRYLALESLDLRLDFVDTPQVVEIGKEIEVRVRLATPGGQIPSLAFLDRHELRLRGAQAPEGCAAQLPAVKPVLLRRGPDGIYRVRQTARARGELCFQAELVPARRAPPGRPTAPPVHTGIVTRWSPPLVVRAVPALKLAGAPVRFGPLTQDAQASASLSLEESDIGEPIEVELNLPDRPDLVLRPATIALDPAGPRAFPLTLAATRDAQPGPATLKLQVRPVKPRGYEDRAIDIDVEVTVVPLTLWERHHLWIEIGAGALVLLVLVLGLALPPRFDRRLVLHYEDHRDPDLSPPDAACPLRIKARAGFYRGARLLVGPTGPVRTGGVLELRPASGRGVTARPLGGKVARELPKGGAASQEPRPVALRDGVFRCAPGVRYEIEGTGLVFWIERSP